ncbi:MAG TPA: hypothetical protein PLJ84_04480 [Bacteroidales bacterium]|nr:hypothetical protein [Bacteroidales bacterium]HPT01832.1 hypothetical protein [Bacteroidales bacterium]
MKLFSTKIIHSGIREHLYLKSLLMSLPAIMTRNAGRSIRKLLQESHGCCKIAKKILTGLCGY